MKQYPACVVVLASLLAMRGQVAAQEKPAERPANRLSKETSPYLLQHAHNPVDWFPWGPEALEKAKREGKLIFLSVGYSSCHWCHVMERESFADKEIARYLNEHYVCIKVDREERPDVDAIYMAALSVYNELAETGRGGGWPLTMFLTPEAEPFVGGTYFPARDGDREGVSGIFQLLQKVQQIWNAAPDKIRGDANQIVTFTRRHLEEQPPREAIRLEVKWLDAAQAALAEDFDEKYGGFGYSPDGRRPKFPSPSKLLFLLDRYERTKNEQAGLMLAATLDHMARGGIRDHLGGGFHRYSVDRYWRIPHFEKMLYDNGQLAGIYARAAKLLKRDDFARVSREICDFVLRELTEDGGGFFTAIDADSEGEEGKFYRWEKSEVESLLSAEEYALLASVYGFDRALNFDEKYYVPQLGRPLAEIAAEQKLSELQLDAKLQPLRAKLLAARAQRKRPLTDTKILTAECGLMIGGLAEAGRILDERKYVEAAAKAADFLLRNMRSSDGRLMRTFAGGQARIDGYLNDYAFVSEGLLKLHETTGNRRWLDAAAEITAKQVELFQDRQSGGFYFTTERHEALFARYKESVDGALPAGNSVAAGNLILLSRQANLPEYLPTAERTIQATLAVVQENPAAAPRMMVSVGRMLEK